MQPKRKLKNVDVRFISLVDKGANKKRIIWKSNDGVDNTFNKTVKISKIDEEKRIVYGIVYAPNEPDVHGDMMDTQEIEKMAYRFMREGRTRQVDKQHDSIPDEGYVAESWIIRDGDPLFGETGAWAVGIKVEDDETWAEVKAGKITGISLAGMADVERIATKKSILSNILEMIGLKDSIDDQLQDINIYQAFNVIRDAVYEVFSPEFSGDPQFTLISLIDKTKAHYAKANLKLFQDLSDVLSRLIDQATTNTEDITMSDDIDNTINTAIEKALEPIRAEIEKLKAENEELKQSVNNIDIEQINSRLERVEKASNGKQAQDGHAITAPGLWL